MGLVLPAGLDLGQHLTADGLHLTEALEAVGGDLADHFDDVFLFQLGRIVVELAQRAPVLGEHQQPAGTGLQRQAGLLAGEVAFQRALIAGLFGPAALRGDQAEGLFRVLRGRLVEQQGDRVARRGHGVGQQLDLLCLHHELRRIDHHAIHRDPATLDVQLRLAARAAEQFNQAFGQADGFRHGDDLEKGRPLYPAGAVPAGLIVRRSRRRAGTGRSRAAGQAVR